jgi:hypothetical protein
MDPEQAAHLAALTVAMKRLSNLLRQGMPEGCGYVLFMFDADQPEHGTAAFATSAPPPIVEALLRDFLDRQYTTRGSVH